MNWFFGLCADVSPTEWLLAGIFIIAVLFFKLIS